MGLVGQAELTDLGETSYFVCVELCRTNVVPLELMTSSGTTSSGTTISSVSDPTTGETTTADSRRCLSAATARSTKRVARAELELSVGGRLGEEV